MASLDFIFDILEKVETQNIDYFLITVQEDKGGNHKADVFYNFSSDIAAESALVVTDGVIADIKKKYGIELKGNVPKIVKGPKSKSPKKNKDDEGKGPKGEKGPKGKKKK